VKIGYHLAPVAVLPERHGKGLGHRIIAESLRAIGDHLPVYVLGNPAYYIRFGFKIDRTQKCIFDPSGDQFMVLNSGGPLPPRQVLYEGEFTTFLG
jgi:predicted N-acetyltransferase YhbS